jgi:hypothetical protein
MQNTSCQPIVACTFTIIFKNLPIIVYLSCFQGQVLNPDTKFIVTQMGHVLNCIYCYTTIMYVHLQTLTKINIFSSLHNFILQYNMTNFYTTKLTDKEICKISKYIKTKITVGNCHIWNGQQLKGYGIFEFRFRKHKIKLRVHRLQMYIHNGCRAIDTVQHVSHLCHNNLCVRIEHLSLETAQINNNRQICKNNGECTGHYGLARCILHNR